ncbi:MAG TPA: hypothetical protein VJ765_00305 [Chitinophagaceae bacterium]|nr:hypothetical protein [Chitinophagaceae bacterium]
MKRILASTIIFSLLAFAPKNKLVGRWETKISPKGNITGVVFNKDNTYEGFINKKPFVSGNYSLHRNTITIEENGCNGAKATYKLIFFSHSDSLRFEPITDSCTERREGMTRTILGRVK